MEATAISKFILAYAYKYHIITGSGCGNCSIDFDIIFTCFTSDGKQYGTYADQRPVGNLPEKR